MNKLLKMKESPYLGLFANLITAIELFQKFNEHNKMEINIYDISRWIVTALFSYILYSLIKQRNLLNLKVEQQTKEFNHHKMVTDAIFYKFQLLLSDLDRKEHYDNGSATKNSVQHFASKYDLTETQRTKLGDEINAYMNNK